MLKNNNLIMKQTNEWKAKWNSTPKKTLENSTFSLKLSSYLTLIINAWDCHYWKTWPLGFVMIKSNIRIILPKNACEDSLNPFSPTPPPQKKKKKKKKRFKIWTRCKRKEVLCELCALIKKSQHKLPLLGLKPGLGSNMRNSQWRVINTQNNNDKNTLY